MTQQTQHTYEKAQIKILRDCLAYIEALTPADSHLEKVARDTLDLVDRPVSAIRFAARMAG